METSSRVHSAKMLGLSFSLLTVPPHPLKLFSLLSLVICSSLPLKCTITVRYKSVLSPVISLVKNFKCLLVCHLFIHRLVCLSISQSAIYLSIIYLSLCLSPCPSCFSSFIIVVLKWNLFQTMGKLGLKLILYKGNNYIKCLFINILQNFVTRDGISVWETSPRTGRA